MVKTRLYLVEVHYDWSAKSYIVSAHNADEAKLLIESDIVFDDDVCHVSITQLKASKNAKIINTFYE